MWIVGIVIGVLCFAAGTALALAELKAIRERRQSDRSVRSLMNTVQAKEAVRRQEVADLERMAGK